MRAYLAWILAMLVSVAPGAFGAAEIIIDNPNAEMVGTWTTGTMSATRYGDDYYWVAQSLTGGKSATYMPFIPQTSADWSVYTWYPAGSNRPTQAQFIVHTGFSDSTVYVNQQINGQQWFRLGTYPMDAGPGNCVLITNYGSETDKVVMADAIRFYSPSASVPSDTIPPIVSSLTAQPEVTKAVISWTTDEPSTTQVEYGESTSYGNVTPKQTALVLNHSVIITGLTFPTTYHFRVISEDLNGNLAVSDDHTFTTTTEIPQTPSFRAAWASTGFRSADEVTATIDTLHQANYNVLIPLVRGIGGTYYDSAFENRSIQIIDPPPFDPLADMVAKGHAVGMEVHPWISVYRIAFSSLVNAPPVFYEHPEWLTKNNMGEMISNDRYTLDPGVPGVQDYLCKIVLDIVSKYDVDGFNLDYIRYEGNTWGYNEITRQRFYDEYGFWPPNSAGESGWDAWCDYRRQQVTDLVKKCYLEVMGIKPHVKMTADVQSYGGLDSGFEGSSPYSYVLQDWKRWMEEHILDASIPMNYKDESVEYDAKIFRDWSQFTVDNRYGRHGYVGTAPYQNTITNSVTQIYSAISTGADGISTFSYASTNSEGLPASDFYDAIRTHLYTAPVPTPEMPWKTAPTTGIIFGNVTDASHPSDPIYQDWVYKATVTVTGPVIRSTLTDATGTYGFLDLPPGTYSITCSKAGLPTRTYADQTITAGQVLRDDFELGYTTAVSPPGAVVNGWSLLSLPLEPVNPQPESVFAGIDIDGKLYRWDNPSQGLYLYDTWSPEQFGEMNIENGYWLQSSAPGAISYQAFAGNSATHDIPIPSSGWAIIGCPFVSDRQWASTLVKRGAETATIITARSNLWLDTVGYWWDATHQGLCDLGIPEDYASSETLRPWHGYWVQTYVDGLTLTIR